MGWYARPFSYHSLSVCQSRRLRTLRDTSPLYLRRASRRPTTQVPIRCPSGAHVALLPIHLAPRRVRRGGHAQESRGGRPKRRREQGRPGHLAPDATEVERCAGEAGADLFGVAVRVSVWPIVGLGLGEGEGSGSELGSELGVGSELGLGLRWGLEAQAPYDDAHDNAEDDATVDARYAREGAHRYAPLQPRYSLPLRRGLLAYDLPELDGNAERRRQHAERDEAVRLAHARLAYPLAWSGLGGWVGGVGLGLGLD